MNNGMKRYYNQPVIFLPALHKQLIYDNLPSEVLLLNPGLPQTSQESNIETSNSAENEHLNAHTQRFTSPHLVYQPRAAEACLRDLLNFEETVQDLSAATAQRIVGEFWRTLSPVENEDLINFVENKGKLNTNTLKGFQKEMEKSVEILYQEIFEQAQKNLLLTWSHEENILSIAELLLKASQSTAELRANIKEPTQSVDFSEGATNNLNETSSLLNSAYNSQGLSINDLIDEIMQESGLNSYDLQPEWSAVLIGALCLTEPNTLFYTTEPEFYQLLSEIYPDEEDLPQALPLCSEDRKQLFPSTSQHDSFAVCEIAYRHISKVYTSPLLKRLIWLEQDKRQKVTFIYKV